LGSKPLKPVLAKIAAIKSKKDLPAFLANVHQYAGGFIFGFSADQDFGDATQVIASTGAGGLGLPDRDYYTKDDERSKTIREKYVAHVAKMLELAGQYPESAAADAKTVMKIETDLAKASLTRVERRDPYKIYHKMSVADLEKITPSFDWQTYLAASGIPNIKTINVTQPKFLEAVDQELKSVSLNDWKAYLRWHAAHAAAP